MRIIKSLLVFSLAGCMVLSAHASDEAKLLLLDMAANARTANYQGFFTYERGVMSRSFKLYHMVDGELEKQRLVLLEGEPLEIINDGHSLSCVHPGERAIHAQGISMAAAVDVNQSKIWQYYDAIMLENTRIAGREAKRVYLKPKDQNRYAYVFGIDAEKNTLLKMQLIDDAGRSLERFRFIDIEYDTVTAADITAEDEKHFQHVAHGQPDGQAVQSAWQVGWLPNGFSEEHADVHNSHTQTIEERHMYSDGLSAFSVFIEKSDVNTPQSVEKRQGGTVAVSRFVVDQGQQYRVTVVGEIPAPSAKIIVQSVALAK